MRYISNGLEKNEESITELINAYNNSRSPKYFKTDTKVINNTIDKRRIMPGLKIIFDDSCSETLSIKKSSRVYDNKKRRNSIIAKRKKRRIERAIERIMENK